MTEWLGFTMAAKGLTDFMKELRQFEYCYLELPHCLVFEHWPLDAVRLQELEPDDLLQAGRLFGAEGELRLRRHADGTIHGVYLGEAAFSLPRGVEPLARGDSLQRAGEETALLWGEWRQSGGDYFALRVGGHQYPPLSTGAAPPRVSLVVQSYCDAAGEPAAYRWSGLVGGIPPKEAR